MNPEEFLSNTARLFSQHLENQAIGLYDDNLTDPTIPTDTGETYNEIQNLGVFSGDIAINFVEGVDSSNPTDFYQFSIDQSTNLSITLDGLSADADLSIFNSSRELLGLSENLDLEAEVLEGNLAAGTYFVGVASYDGIDTSYDLTISSGNSALSSVETNLGVDPVSMSPEFSVM